MYDFKTWRNGKNKDGWRKQVFVSDSDDREQQIKYLGSRCGRRLVVSS